MTSDVQGQGVVGIARLRVASTVKRERNSSTFCLSARYMEAGPYDAGQADVPRPHQSSTARAQDALSAVVPFRWHNAYLVVLPRAYAGHGGAVICGVHMLCHTDTCTGAVTFQRHHAPARRLP